MVYLTNTYVTFWKATAVFRMNNLGSSIKHQASSIKHQASSIKHQASSAWLSELIK
jgi:hypothetical protein